MEFPLSRAPALFFDRQLWEIFDYLTSKLMKLLMSG